jgi:hypothetical protein
MRGGEPFPLVQIFFEQISESKFQIITEVVSALFARVGREVLLVTRLEQRYSWPRYPSERPGEGVRDLITNEPEQSGSFFLLADDVTQRWTQISSEPEYVCVWRRSGSVSPAVSRASRPAEQAPPIVRLSADH